MLELRSSALRISWSMENNIIRCPIDIALTWSDTEVQMTDKSASSGGLQEGFQKELWTELRFREWMNGQEWKSQRAGRRVFLALETERGITLRHGRQAQAMTMKCEMEFNVGRSGCSDEDIQRRATDTQMSGCFVRWTNGMCIKCHLIQTAMGCTLLPSDNLLAEHTFCPAKVLQPQSCAGKSGVAN